MDYSDKQIQEIFKALSDVKRIAVLRFLQEGEKCACKIQEKLDIAQPALSYHMKILVDSGLVDCRHEGKWNHYSFNQNGKEKAIKIIEELFIKNENKEKTCSKCK